MLKIKINKDFKLKDTVTCGQIFRFETNDDDSYTIIIKDRVIRAKESNGYLEVTSNKLDNLEEVVKEYFDLNNDYEKMNNYLLERDAKLKDAIEFSKGLMMIKQDPFETLISYIISANNGVPQIASALNNIAFNYGKKVTFENKEYYLFPQYKDLKDIKIEEYRNCKVGFRDKYIYDIVKKLNNKEFDLDIIRKLSTEDAMNYLMQNNGIGPKVASCILLFAYQKYDVFPVDTWVKKSMKKDYGIEGEKNIRKFSKELYGNYSGIALQYLFNYSRNFK